ncbi:MAG TPA: hypothetical protein VMB26_10785 [Candidatus Binataceae bacterium]|nr:hypothetical protein [Candidatus Binataceae bacterium]
MRRIKIIASVIAAIATALALTGCSTEDASFLPGAPQLMTSGLPSSCSGPESYTPESPCAKELAEAEKQPDFRLIDTRDLRLYHDDACAAECAWQPGSTCHLLTEGMQHAVSLPSAITFQSSKGGKHGGDNSAMPALP